MPNTIAALMDKLQPDPLRAKVGFSPEMRSALDISLAFEPGKEEEVSKELNEWVRKHQPCLFGRIAAKQSAIIHCLISENMLYGSEVELEKQIQNARLRWTRAGFEGHSSNFIISVLSKKLATALPDESVKAIAIRLCSLYLKEPVEPDRVYLDRLWLEQPGSDRATWEWVVGVNYFSAQADGRWWQDHRFPAGIAFSMNSVGHMVKSGKLVRALHDLQEAMGTTLPGYNTPNVYSLDQGLELAMATINKASDGPSGKATFLIPLQPNDTERGGCPVELPKFLSGFDYSQYKGFYHTDFTLPSEYFRPDVTRPTNVEPYNLDFTYLFLKDLTNPDFDRMGEGRRIRLSGSDATGGINPTDKRIRAQATEVRIADVPRLREALELKH